MTPDNLAQVGLTIGMAGVAVSALIFVVKFSIGGELDKAPVAMRILQFCAIPIGLGFLILGFAQLWRDFSAG